MIYMYTGVRPQAFFDMYTGVQPPPPCIHHPPNAHHSSSKSLLQEPFSRPQQRMVPQAIELMHSFRQLLIPASTVVGSNLQSTHISGPIYPHHSEKFEAHALALRKLPPLETMFFILSESADWYEMQQISMHVGSRTPNRQ